MPRTADPSLEVFLDLLFPWEDEHKDLYKAVTWTFPDKAGGKDQFANYGAQSYTEVVRLIESRINRSTNVYMALGAYRMADSTKKTVDGFSKIIRKVNNVVSLRSIYLDLDVKADAYANTQDAFNALDDFCTALGLPEPTMEVLSGNGGVHVYWCTKEPMPLQSWVPLATALRDAAVSYGLKFDPMVTIDAARILRVPGSFNYKSGTGKPVLMMQDSSCVTYEYQQLVSALGKFIGNSLVGVRQPLRNMNYTQNFTDNTNTAPPVGIDDVAVNCGVISDILEREGDGDAEPLWNQAVLLASFTDNPKDAAHRMSRGDPRYIASDTDQKLHDKINARAQNPQLGWPQCATFSTLHSACQTCPLFAQKKSPLSFARKPTQQHQQQAPRPGTDDLMPPGYWRDIDSHVFTAITLKDGSSIVVDVIGYPIVEAGVDPTDEHDAHIVFKTVIGHAEKWGRVSVSNSLSPQGAAEALAKGSGVYVKPVNYTHTRDFLVAWMTHLQAVKKTIMPASYGWTKDGTGFTFDNTTYLENGSVIAYRGDTFDDRFAVYGQLQPWRDALRLVYGNPALETIVATAFAAPLVELAGSASLIVSAFSHKSGVGKSTAMMLAQSVWGDPTTGMSSFNDTNNSVMKKINDLKSLPVYWDELRTKDQLEKVIELVFAITQGKGKSRLTRDIAQAKVNAFRTMFTVASNHGIGDTVYSQTDGTEAGGLRVFEIETDRELNQTGIHGAVASQIQKQVETNYGAAGALYSAYVAEHRKVLVGSLSSIRQELDRRHHFDSKERFWAMTMATLMLGARLANRCGLTTFDIKAMDKFIEESLLAQRDLLKDEGATTMSAPDSGNMLMQEIMAELRGKNMIMTDRINYGAGRPFPIELMDLDVSRLGDVWLQVGVKDKRIRVRVKPFNDYLRKRGLNPSTVRKMLEKDYAVTPNKAAIGTGVAFLDALSHVAGGRMNCYDLTPLNVPYSTPGGPGQ